MPRVGPEHEDYAPRGPYVLGFPLGDLSFGAFSSKRMFDPRWHLRRERFVAYQLAMLICLAAECTATYSLSKYEDLQTHIESRFSPAHLYNNDIIDMQISTIVMCVAVACWFGADFFFLLQFPRHSYPRWYASIKKAMAIVITLGILACAIGSTVVVARNSALIQHVDDATKRAAAEYYFRPPLRYRDWAVNIAWVCLIWPGWLACVASTVLMFMADTYDLRHGTSPRFYGASPSSGALARASSSAQDRDAESASSLSTAQLPLSATHTGAHKDVVGAGPNTAAERRAL
ncbi:hypothetical protein JCM10450v2_007738 [Rhodotorula kratochvilovae]